jgi:hypothetical protein
VVAAARSGSGEIDVQVAVGRDWLVAMRLAARLLLHSDRGL